MRLLYGWVFLQILYVYVELYQGSGGLWPTYVEFALQSLVAGQLLLGFLFLSSQAYVQV